jgi:two-component system, sensor histidine kinase and response regulator
MLVKGIRGGAMKTEILLTERSRAAEILRESEQRYQRLLAATSDYVYTVDLEHGLSRSTSHGPGCEAVTGYVPSDFSNNPYLWYHIIHEEDRPAVMAQISHILQGESPPPIEHRIVRRDGQLRWIRNTTIPHRDLQGKLVTYDGLINDITERKLAERALRESQERLELVIRGSNDGIWDWNITTNEAYFSPRWKSMLGYEDHEIENRFSAWKELIHPDDRDLAQERIRSYFAGEIPVYELEHRLRHKDGSYRWILARGVVLRDASGQPVRMAGSHMDLTELKSAVEHLKQANLNLQETQRQLIQAARFESIGTLAAGVAHEVKNPLQTILMGLHYLSQTLKEPGEDVKLTLSDMRESVARANAIISDLLTLSKVTQFQMKNDNLNGTIQRSLRLVHNQLDAAQVAVNQNLVADPPLVEIDESRLEQVFLNLFLNSLQAMPNGGTITVTTRILALDESAAPAEPRFRKFKLPQTLLLAEVQDTGTGIKEADLPRVFDPFFTTKPPGVGTGLGLSMAKMIIDRHDGVIEVNNAPEGGVRVTIALKAQPEGGP